MKILVLSQYYSPENVPIPAEVARGLSARGHQVQVLTGFPNYPSGRFFDGYPMQWRRHDIEANVPVTRVPLYADHSQSSLRRMANYASFGLSSASARRLIAGADVVYVYATQMTAALGPWLWSRIGGTPYVLHVQDLWPDSVTGSALGDGRIRSRSIEAILNPWLKDVYRKSSGVIAIAPGMVETLRSRGVDPSKLDLVYNWAQTSDQVVGDGHVVEEASTTTVLYAGNVGEMQDLGTAIQAAVSAADSGVELRIVGDGVALSGLRRLAERLGARNVSFSKPVPREDMPREYSAADFALVSLKDLPVFRSTIPSKLQSALAHGVPVLTTVQGDVRDFVERSASGITAEAEDVASLAGAFRTATAMGRSERRRYGQVAREAFRKNFTAEAGLDGIEEALCRAVNNRKVNR